MTNPEKTLAQTRERMRRYRQRKKQAGIIEIMVSVPADRADEIREIAARMRSEADV